jgi:two-component system chemotaxis response regulator CheB
VSIKVLVVDDSAFSRQTIRKMLESSRGIEVVGVAADGMDAMAKTIRLVPDLITLDFNMPKMDGFSFLRWVMKEQPTPVIMVSAHDENALASLEMGAVDFIAKPTKRASVELKNIEKDLLSKVRGVKDFNMTKVSKSIKRIESRKKSVTSKLRPLTEISVVAVGASTGGPPALQVVLSEIPRDFPSGIVVSQHMPKGFTKTLAERLNRCSHLSIKEAETGDIVEPGRVLISPGGAHMTFRKNLDNISVFIDEPRDRDKYVPSVDLMMLSAVKCFDEKVMGVMLTGMGNDGMKGMVAIRKKGGYTIAESEETAVVFGMPGEAIKAGAVQKVTPLELISKEIVRVAMGERRHV